MRKLGILFVMLLLMSALALAVPAPKTLVIGDDVGFNFEYPTIGSYAQNTSLTLYFHIFNASNGVPIYNNTLISCLFHLYNQQGGYLFDKNYGRGDFDPVHEEDVRVFIDQNNFSQKGLYRFVWQCNASYYGGSVSNEFYITKGGMYPADDLLTTTIYILFIIATLGLLFALLWNVVKIATLETSVLDVMFSWMFIVLMLIVIYLGENYLIRTFIEDIGNFIFGISIWSNGLLPIISLAVTILVKTFRNKRPPTVPEIWGEKR